MLKYSRLPFKTKYREPLKGAISTGSMPCSMYWMEPVPVTRLACMETLQERLNIGFNGLLLKASPVCWMETILDVQPVCLSTIWLICAKISVAIPENWDMTKTCGMDCCCLTILFQKYSISLGIRQCQRLFHQLGFSLQRPRRKASEADGPRQEAFKKTTTS